MIRHRHDYGAIIFCDHRFANQRAIEQLPVWVKPYVKVFNKFGESQGLLSKFFRKAAQDPTLNSKPSSSSSSSSSGIGEDGARAGGAGGGGSGLGYNEKGSSDTFLAVKRQSSGSSGSSFFNSGRASSASSSSSRGRIEIETDPEAARPRIHSSNIKRAPRAGLLDSLGAMKPASVQVGPPPAIAGGGIIGSAAVSAGGGSARPAQLNPFDSNWKAGSHRSGGGSSGGGTSSGSGGSASVPPHPTPQPRIDDAGNAWKREGKAPMDVGGGVQGDGGSIGGGGGAAGDTAGDTAGAPLVRKRSLYGPTKGGEAKKKPKANKAIQDYIASVKAALDSREFKKQFVPLLRTYQTDSKDAPSRAMLTLVTQFKLLFGRLGEDGDRLIAGFRGTLPAEKRDEFDTAHARMAGSTVLAAARDSAETPAEPAGGGGSGNIIVGDASSKKRLLHGASGKHSVSIDQLPGYTANEEAAADDAAYADAQARSSGAGAGAGAEAGAADVDCSPPSAQPQHTKRAKTASESTARASSASRSTKTCPHCKHPPVAPFSAPCGHVACYSCWKDIINQGGVSGQYPCAEKACKTLIRKKHLRKAHF